MGRLLVVVAACALALVAGCSGSTTLQTDSGQGTDAASEDASSGTDTGALDDAGSPLDAGTDAAAPNDANVDAARDRASVRSGPARRGDLVRS